MEGHGGKLREPLCISETKINRKKVDQEMKIPYLIIELSCFGTENRNNSEYLHDYDNSNNDILCKNKDGDNKTKKNSSYSQIGVFRKNVEETYQDRERRKPKRVLKRKLLLFLIREEGRSYIVTKLYSPFSSVWAKGNRQNLAKGSINFLRMGQKICILSFVGRDNQ
ncbi:hypothetical protein HHI36_002420 [Cryptolaemus montrouzieri]|uniref:Uncharacterized protein n=1 Tax=Cryptolaemus montrouzieri TaxID=559131 RepID=A0ABD2PAX9_9CUCU